MGVDVLACGCAQRAVRRQGRQAFPVGFVIDRRCAAHEDERRTAVARFRRRLADLVESEAACSACAPHAPCENHREVRFHLARFG